MTKEEAPVSDLTEEVLIQETAALFSETLTVLRMKTPELETLIARYLANPRESRKDEVRFYLENYNYMFWLEREDSKVHLHLHNKPLVFDTITDEFNLYFEYGDTNEIKKASFGHTRTWRDPENIVPSDFSANTMATATEIRDILHDISKGKLPSGMSQPTQ